MNNCEKQENESLDLNETISETDINTECTTKLKQLEEKIVSLETDIKSLKEEEIRQLANFDNLRKRIEKEKQDYLKHAEERVLTQIVDIFENLNRAMESSKTNSDFDTLLKGLEITYNQFQNFLKQEEVEVFHSKGEQFDPHLHYAIASENNSEYEDEQIIDEIKLGYKLKGKVIKPSLVKICKK